METEKLKDSILKLRLEGYSITNIKNILGCSVGVISYHINKNGMGGVHENYKTTKINDEDFLKLIDKSVIDKIINLKQNGETYKSIFPQVNISQDKVIRICKIFNLNKNKNELRFKDEDFIKKIKELYDKIGSIRKVSEILGVGRKIISSIVEVKTQTAIERRKSSVEHVVRCRKNRKKRLVEYKGGCCQRCGYSKSMNALQFHHINPDEKDFTIGGKNYSEEKMKKEVDKCVLVCSNCHCEIHEEITETGKSEFIVNYSKRELL